MRFQITSDDLEPAMTRITVDGVEMTRVQFVDFRCSVLDQMETRVVLNINAGAAGFEMFETSTDDPVATRNSTLSRAMTISRLYDETNGGLTENIQTPRLVEMPVGGIEYVRPLRLIPQRVGRGTLTPRESWGTIAQEVARA